MNTSRTAALLFSLFLTFTARAEAAAVFDPIRFFTGRTQSTGVFENSRGAPTQRVRTETRGRLVGSELRLEQELDIGNRPRQYRSWRMRRIDAQHYEATANDMVGIARGQVRGDLFSWSFTLALQPGNPLLNVRMTQHMMLQPDGRTMVNRSIVRKFGVQVGAVTEQFRRL